MERKLYIMGLGAGSLDALTLQAYRLLQKGYPIYLRTERHPVVELLNQERLAYKSFDYVYDEAENFDQVYVEIVQQLLNITMNSTTPIIYAVPGHPMVAERSVKQLREQAKSSGIEIELVSSSSFLDDMFNSLCIDPNEGFILLDGLDFDETLLDSRMHVIITQVYNQEVMSEAKLALMEYYPEDTMVTVIKAAGVKDLERIWTIPIYEIDHINDIDHLTALYIPKGSQLIQQKSFGQLVDIVKRLRGPDGCPWDQEQTHDSLRGYLIEETYEVLEAIDSGDVDNLMEELGDLLLHVVMHAQIAKDEGEFSIYQVIETIARKMIRRHPHVFQGDKVENVEQVLENWDDIKKQEKACKQAGEQVESILDGIPKGLPMLMYAYKQQKKAAKVGFDWDLESQVWDKLHEELKELEEAETTAQKTDELGDALYAIVNLARFMEIDPEQALHNTCRKFEHRFRYIEEQLKKEGLSFKDVDLEWMETQWQNAKKVKK
ncbi:nucleoside triphosphate pyrophosphohydrolase [Desulfuribacillus alkaliarsenatis]|uniref:Nucleoside triphosphate pyrophosphohydrolase n=1 Tax=Desulfuribacillus alkaliarsenatis TaxID=766136 RepID=A0A1E5FZ37_9FIRM|nr:nucleoside triphosphate pyrophosphohydrolase [Desulfuribacillus alkaliarsenatis]OEF95761.1 nucleoside triphosphate pyrophosphohydrolase [Desulfuribacillus alkaliarsenatis]